MVLIILTKTEPIRAAPKPETAKPSKKDAVNQNSTALITKINKPRERSVIGKVRKTSIGRTNTFNKPSIKAATIAEYKPSTVTPGSNFATISSAKAPISTRAIIFIGLS